MNPHPNKNIQNQNGGARGFEAATPACGQNSPESAGVVDAKKIYVCRKTYNTIRSFYFSSSKQKYYWNIGVRAATDRIDFTKIAKWKLCVYFSPVYKFIDQIWLFNPDYTAAIVINFDQITIISGYEPTKTITINRDAQDLIAYYILPLPEEPVKFECPINLMEVYVKIISYVKKAGMPFGKLEDNGIVYAEEL
jgi:hypothetical protein